MQEDEDAGQRHDRGMDLDGGACQLIRLPNVGLVYASMERACSSLHVIPEECIITRSGVDLSGAST